MNSNAPTNGIIHGGALSFGRLTVSENVYRMENQKFVYRSRVDVFVEGPSGCAADDKLTLSWNGCDTGLMTMHFD